MNEAIVGCGQRPQHFKATSARRTDHYKPTKRRKLFLFVDCWPKGMTSKYSWSEDPVIFKICELCHPFT